MLHYIALTWNETDSLKGSEARSMLQRFMAETPSWKIAVQQEGLVVCISTTKEPDVEDPYILHRCGGVILGKLFDRSYAERDDTSQTAPGTVVLDERCSAAIIASGGRVLIENYWGQYVAFLRDATSRTSWVVRDPGGRIPCQWTCFRGIDVYFVRLEDCVKLGVGGFTVDPDYLLGYMTYGNVCVRHTALKEIETILPGECVEHGADKRRRSFYWNPLEIAERDVIEDPDEAVRLLRRTVRACVHAWASCFDGIVLKLSGGLDSSIVASCLVDAPTRPRILCHNIYSSSTPSLDERPFSRLVANRMRFELIEEEPTLAYDFKPISELRLVPYPYAWWLSDRESGIRENAFFRSRGMQVRFTGDGGDELFVTATAVPSSANYLWRHGISSKLFSIALDDAVGSNTSLWKILQISYRYGLRGDSWHMRATLRPESRPLMSPQALKQARDNLELWHPLFREVGKVPRAKFVQAYTLTSGATRSYAPNFISNPIGHIAALRSQPLVELCLRIPIYVLVSGGQNRALARRAFTADLPGPVISRNAKALGTSQLKTVFFKHVSLARELLLDGFLVREGLIDRNKLKVVLSGDVSRIPSHILELGPYLDIEAWVRNWDKTLQQAAA